MPSTVIDVIPVVGILCTFVYKFSSLTLKEERRLKVLENRVLRRIFGPNRHEELYVLYTSPNIIRVIKSRRIRWAENVECMGERRGIYWVLVRRQVEESICKTWMLMGG